MNVVSYRVVFFKTKFVIKIRTKSFSQLVNLQEVNHLFKRLFWLKAVDYNLTEIHWVLLTRTQFSMERRFLKFRCTRLNSYH